MLETPVSPVQLGASEAVAAHLANLRASLMPQQTIDVHAGALRRLAEFLSPRTLVEATPADTRAFLGYLGQVGVTERSLRGYGLVLERWMAFLASRGLSAELSPSLLALPCTLAAAPAVELEAAVTTVVASPAAPLAVGPAPVMATAALAAEEFTVTPRLVAEEMPSGPPPAPARGAPSTPRASSQSGFAPVDGLDPIAIRDATPRDAAVVPAVGAELSAFWGAQGGDAQAGSPASSVARTLMDPAPPPSRRPAFVVAPLPLESAQGAGWRSGPGAHGGPPPPPMSRSRTAPAEADALAGPSIAFAPQERFAQGSRGERRKAVEAPPSARQQAALGSGVIGLAAPPEEEGITALGDAIRPQEGWRRTGDGLPLASAQWGLRQKRSSRSDLDLMDIRTMAKEGRLAPDDMVRKPGGEWTRAADHPLLRQLLIAVATEGQRVARTRPGGRRHDQDAGPCLGLASLGALAGGTAGGVAWWLVAALAGREIGWAALLSGLLAAAGSRLLAPNSTLRPVVGGMVAAASLVGLGLGKLLIYGAILSGVGTIEAGAASSLAGFIAGSLTPVAATCGILGAGLGFALAARPR